jgi:integrase/recombinase XerC
VNQLVPITSAALPTLAATTGEQASIRFLEFFAVNIRNPHKRKAYARSADEFLTWCASGRVAVDRRRAGSARRHLDRGRHVRTRDTKRRLAAIRHLFDWLVAGQVVPVNPAGSVRGPRHVVHWWPEEPVSSVSPAVGLDEPVVAQYGTPEFRRRHSDC